jgi:hypothetical protein
MGETIPPVFASRHYQRNLQVLADVVSGAGVR